MEEDTTVDPGVGHTAGGGALPGFERRWRKPSIITRYFCGGQRVARRSIGVDGEDVLQFLVGDYLGTTRLVLDGKGAKGENGG